MKKLTTFMVLIYLLISCDTKNMQFKGVFAGEFVANKEVNITTNQSKLIEQRLVINDSLFLYSKNKTIILTNISTTYTNAKEGKQIIRGHNLDAGGYMSIRLVNVDWWDNPDSRSVKASVLMTGEYDAKADTIDVYYTQIR